MNPYAIGLDQNADSHVPLSPLSFLPSAAAALGEVTHRGNIVMKGYRRIPKAKAEAFAGGWFRSGVKLMNGCIERMDRAKELP